MPRRRTLAIQAWSRSLLICAWLFSAGQVLGHGDLHEQIDAVSGAIRAKPRDATLYLKRAELHRLHQEPAAAAADYDEAERLDPNLAEVQLGRGKLLVATGKLAEAKRHLDRFLASSPKHVDGLAARARLESKRGRPLSAAEDYERILESSQTPEPEYYLEYARALAAAGPEHVRKGIAVLDKGIARLGPIPTLSLLAIELELSRKDFDSALERVDRMSAASARKEPWLERRGDILQQAGRSADARLAYQAALEEIRTLPSRVRTRKATAELESRLHAKLGSAGATPRSRR